MVAKLIVSLLAAFLCIPALSWAGCTITTPPYEVTRSAIMPPNYYPDPYVITFSCANGTNYTVQYVSPTTTSSGVIYLRYVNNSSRYFFLYFYRDANMTDVIRSSSPTIKTGTATGEQETIPIYPRVQVVTASNCNLVSPNYFCHPGTVRVSITLKIVF